MELAGSLAVVTRARLRGWEGGSEGRAANRFTPNVERILRPEDVAQAVVATLTLPDRATVSELGIRPTNP